MLLLLGSKSSMRVGGERMVVGVIVAVVAHKHQPSGRSLFETRNKSLLPWLSTLIGGTRHIDEAALLRIRECC